MAKRTSPFASWTPIEKDLDFVAGSAGDNWRSLLTNLGITLVDIESFQNGRTTKDACFKGLVHWLKGNVPDEPVTFGTLFQALEDSAMTGCISLLEDKRLKARSRLNRADQDLSTQTNNVLCSRQAVAHRVTESESRPSSLHSSLSELTDTVISDEDAASRLGIVAALDLSKGTPLTQQKTCKDGWRAKDPPDRRLQDAFLRLQSHLAVKLFNKHIDGLKPFLRICQKNEEWPFKLLEVEDIDNAQTFQEIFNKVRIENVWLNTDMLMRLIWAVPDKKAKQKAIQRLEAYHKLLGVFSKFVLLKCLPEDDARVEHFHLSLLPKLRITYDENYEDFPVSKLLEQREFLSRRFNIPIEVFHYVKVESTNSTLVTWALSISSERVFTIFQRASQEFWSLKENSVIRFEIEGILQLHLKGKDLPKLIKEALQCNQDVLSCTEHVSRQFLALVDYSHPKRRSSEECYHVLPQMPSLKQASVPLSEPGVQERTWPSDGMVKFTKGAQTEVVDIVKYQHTPLALAALAEKYNVMYALLANRANLSQLNTLDNHAAFKALSFLIDNNNEDEAELLISNGVGTRGLLSTTPPMTALMWAAQKGKDGLVKQLILEGVSLNERNPDGNSALHFAAQHNHIQCGILLAEGGAEVHTVLSEENLEAQETVGTLHLVTTEFRAAIMQALSFQTKKTVFVVGKALNGKSTLIVAALKRLVNKNVTIADKIRTRLFGVKDKVIMKRSVGIIEPVTISSKRFGEVMFFDGAGQHEYHGPHELFLESIVSRGLVTVIMVVKATEDEPAISQQLKRCLHPFIQLPSSAESSIGVVVVGSYKDKVKSKLKAKEKLELSLRKLKEDLSDSPAVKFHDVSFLDCRKPQAKGISDLYKVLNRIPLPKYTATDSDYNISWVISQIRSSLEVEALSLSALSEWITVNRSNLPAKLPQVGKLCFDLSSTGHFLYLPNKKDICKGWLVLDLPAILHKVYGTIFSPFNRVVNELGLLNCNRLPSLFPTFDPVMIRKILVSLNVCLELDSSLSTELAQIVDISDSSSDYLFFTSLVQAKRPDVFQQEVPGSFILSWQLRVSTDMFISPRLLSTIILRIAARHVFHHKKVVESRSSASQLWWNGIYWPSTEDVDVAVQISDNAVVHVIGRSVVTPSALCAYLSTVTQSILSTIQDLSPGLSCRACIVHPGRPRELLARPRAVSPQEMFPVDFILESRQKQAATCAPLEGTERKFIKDLFGFEPDANVIEKFDFMTKTGPTGPSAPEPASRSSTQPQLTGPLQPPASKEHHPDSTKSSHPNVKPSGLQEQVHSLPPTLLSVPEAFKDPVSQPTTSQPLQQFLADYKERICSEIDSHAIGIRLAIKDVIPTAVAYEIQNVHSRKGNDLIFLHLRDHGDISTLKRFSEVLIQANVEEGGYDRMGRLGNCLLRDISELEEPASIPPLTEDLHS